MTEKREKFDENKKNKELNKDPVVLIKKINDGDSSVFNEIADMYAPLINSVCASFEASVTEAGGNGAVAELRQELSFSLYRAAVTYNIERADTVTFGGYAKKCLINCAVSHLRKTRSAKRKHERAVVKLESKLRSEKAQHTFDTYFGEHDCADRAHLMKRISEVLSKYEYTVFDKYLEGISAGEIARELGTDEKSVNNAVYRSKVKVSEMLKHS